MAERGLQYEFFSGTLRAIRQCVEQSQAPGEMTDSFDMSRTLDRSLPCYLPVGNGPSTQSRLGVVMGQDLGLRFSYLAELIGKNTRNTSMKFAPARLEQRFVRRVLD